MENTRTGVEDQLYIETAKKIVIALVNIFEVRHVITTVIVPRVISILMVQPDFKCTISDNGTKFTLPYWLQENRKTHDLEDNLIKSEELLNPYIYEELLLTTPKFLLQSICDRELLMKTYIKPIIQSFDELCKIDSSIYIYSSNKETLTKNLDSYYKKLYKFINTDINF